ncbi:MAG: helix-turn-helix transcriptional regulator [Pseudomonadota bacterium]
MTPAEFREAREGLGLTGAELAAVMGYGDRSRIYTIEARSVPPQAERLMRAYLAGYRPEDWPAGRD